jgi:hypothetical protein
MSIPFGNLLRRSIYSTAVLYYRFRDFLNGWFNHQKFYQDLKYF